MQIINKTNDSYLLTVLTAFDIYSIICNGFTTINI